MKKLQNIIGLASILLISIALTMSSCGGSGGDEPSEIKLSAITIQGSTTSMYVGEQIVLTTRTFPESVTVESTVWYSSNTNVATVDNSGRVSAIAPGEVSIKATAQGKADEYSITVHAAAEVIYADELSLNKIYMSLEVSTTELLKGTVLPQNATYKTITWSSKSEEIATIDEDGLITGVKVGHTHVVGTVSNGGKDNIIEECYVNVVAETIAATSIQLNKSQITLELGKNEKIVASIIPSDATNQEIEWNSSNASVATIASDGTISAKEIGSSVIKATVKNKDNSEFSATCNVTVVPVYATNITLNKQSTQLYVGNTEQLSATVSPTDTTDKTIIWASSNSSIATVNDNGKITAIKDGSTTITATITNTDNSKVSATCAVVVESIDVSTLTLNASSAILGVGEGKKLSATISPSNATNQTITWSSSNSDVAKVDTNGNVTALKKGSVIITATVKNNDNSIISATCEITVEKFATDLTLNKTSLSLELNQIGYVGATIAPSDATYNTVTWSSSNESIATIDRSGKITPASTGTIYITATLKNGTKGTLTAKCTVEIKPNTIFATDLTITPSSSTIDRGQNVRLQPAVAPSNATYQTVTWASSNSTIASVNSNGLVTGNNAGTATITATLKNGTEADIVITVSITVNESSSGNGDGITDNGEIGEVGTN